MPEKAPRPDGCDGPGARPDGTPNMRPGPATAGVPGRACISRPKPLGPAGQCRSVRAGRPRRHRFRAWRRWAANARRRSTLTIWWRSAQVNGAAGSRGRPPVLPAPVRRSTVLARRRSGNSTMMPIPACPKVPPCPGTGMTRIPGRGRRVPAGAVRGGFAPAPRPASLPDEG